VEAAPNEPFDHARYVVEREPWPGDERARVEALHRETEAIVWEAAEPEVAPPLA
jgi:hypothetical protein